MYGRKKKRGSYGGWYDRPQKPTIEPGSGIRGNKNYGSTWWGQLLADIFQVQLTLYAGGETGGALGAARLAWLADGGVLAEVCTLPPVKQQLVPSATDVDLHKARHARFRTLYVALCDQFQ